jgi:hypothetical protein
MFSDTADVLEFTVGGDTNLSISSGYLDIAQYIRHIGDTNTYFGFVSSDNFIVVTSGAEIMRVNSSGNVGIGTTGPSRKLDVVGVIQAQGAFYSTVSSSSTNLATANGGQLSLYNSSSTDGNFSNIGGYNSNSLVTSQICFVNESHANRTGAIVFLTHNGGSMPERMRITSAGNVGINKTSPAVKLDVSDSIAGSGFTNGLARFENTIETSTGGAGVLNIANNYQGGFGTLIKFWFEESSVATINFNSSTNAVVYNTTSDYRLKEDLKSFNGLEIVDQIKTYNYKWKKADARGYGALAHELQEVFPDAVTGEKDGEDMQGVDYSTLVPVLIKSIQELKAEIELLKQQINN